ncbi:ArsR family transcriptional regulator [Natrarchaeobius halalkaliphilus]|uniref:ArsR family transcriptional regulator n=1 Tax=Natrarchaeobius halalkaliphilus TaxID=1679091 RepID=A0A3N6P0K4_9EURY|nr:ArsR family transcriptional regulator [Natrarchaeobius halalkaliphilus]RQG88028.1 ArsR family transcriptional regulator [Natrarchaeobius halalkaliphilus]
MTECQIVDRDGVVRCVCEADEILRLLANGRRRQIIAFLESHEDDWARIETLIDDISTTTTMTDDDWETEFHHVHAPMLEASGLIEYDGQNGTIRYYHCELVSTVVDVVNARQ